ncbi:MAG: UDP-glucuronic acid decarboxylase family protein [Terriglobia bacterium]
MRIVVTGGGGFLGSHLCEKFLALRYSVLCIDNLATGSPNNIRQLERHPNFEFRLHDVTKRIDVEGAVDAVAHLASPASPPDYLRLPIQTLKVGSLGTHNALGLAKAKQARFLLASTSQVYGDPLVNPQPENYSGNVNLTGPRGVYDEAKRFAEAMTLAYHRYHGLDTRIARIFNTYGPRMRPHDGRVVSNFIVQALRGEPVTVFGDGTQTRSLCYVSDLIDGLTKLLLAERRTGTGNNPCDLDGIHGPVNLGNPTEMGVLDIAEEVIRWTCSSSRIEYRSLPIDDPRVRCPDVTRAKQVLGWSPSVSFEHGLAATVEYFRRVV